MLVETASTLPLRSLNACRRETYDAARERRETERARRIESGAYLEDETDWDHVRTVIAAAGLASGKVTPSNSDVRAALVDALERTAPLPAVLDDYDPCPEWDGIEVSLRILTRLEYVALDMAFAHAAKHDEIADQAIANGAAYRAYVAATVAEITGIEDQHGAIEIKGDPLTPRALRILEVNELLLPIFNLAKGAQQLSPKQRRTFGCAPPSTSATDCSIVRDALVAIANGKDAMATDATDEDDQRGSATMSTQATPVPDDSRNGPASTSPLNCITTAKDASASLDAVS